MKDAFVRIRRDGETEYYGGLLEEDGDCVKVTAKTNDGGFELTYAGGRLKTRRTGDLKYDMTFAEGKEFTALMSTPYGAADFRYETKRMYYYKDGNSHVWDLSYIIADGETVQTQITVIDRSARRKTQK